MILIDTSAWIEFFRGKSSTSESVGEAITGNDAALCGAVVTELRRGLRSTRERRRVLPLLEGCHRLSQPSDVWEEAGDLGFFLARKGITAKSMDLLIATYALAHGAALLTLDADFAAMKRAGVGLVLVD